MTASDDPDLNQILAYLFEFRPESAVDFYKRTLGQPLPEFDIVDPGTIRIQSPERPELDRKLPLAILLRDGDPVYGMLFDVLRGASDDQAMLWLPAIGSAQDSYQCPVALVVPCLDRATAKWALAYSKWEDQGCYALPLLIPSPEDLIGAKR
ncbi:hypothetical protein [Glycomyces xiaoerkulensis]|uniref:hypothetical protein n=1 Tax=Glycomyces xiaoerkulensis TaxID=2038139 RepID=UPI000C26B755|nr:hypothetical protein [Glycomyces xiaoerkulensis]